MTIKRPNFLVIVADDLGFTDLSAFGGEISTPNLNKLAQEGLRFTDFHTASACSPTRSMLFSGTDNHIAGLGQMAEFVERHESSILRGKPGYEGYLNYRVAALPEILHDNDYYTFISGKWHLGLLPEYWPCKRGFEKSFTLLPGAGNHFKYFPREKDTGEYIKFIPPMFAEDDIEIDPESLPQDYYSTQFFTDKALSFLNKEYRGDRPFFGALTYTAPHWPYQAPQDRIAKYNGFYNDGPEELRIKRLNQALKAGIIPDGVEPHKMITIREKRWHQLSDEERAIEVKIMQTYAAMVEILDEQIGRVINRLEKDGELDNTFITFMSDNGAEGMLMEAMPLRVVNVQQMIREHYDNSVANIGNKNSWVYYGDQWAQAATAPSYMYKMWASEGGIRCPLILHYPPIVQKKGSIIRSFATVMDILPTILEIAGIDHPGTLYKGRTVATPKGKSWVSHVIGQQEYIHSEDTVTGWELFGQQAIRKGPYKVLFIPKPYGPGVWQLFDIKNDPGETTDLAPKYPDKLDELLKHWTEYVAETGLIEITPEDLDITDFDYTICE